MNISARPVHHFFSVLTLLAATLQASMPARAQQPDAPKCRYAKLATLQVSFAGETLGPVITGEINGLPAQMLINTGSADIYLTRTAIERHKLTRWSSNMLFSTLDSKSHGYRARVRQFKAALASTKNVEFDILPDFGSPPLYEAMLGTSFLFQTDVEMSLATKEIRFFQPSNCGNRSLAYWDPDAIELPFLQGGPDKELPAFMLLVNGKKVKTVIVSGAPVTVLMRPAAQRLGLKLVEPDGLRLRDRASTDRGEIDMWSTTLDSLQLGGENIQNVEVGVVDSSFGDVDLILGADFLRTHRVLFAMSQLKLYVSYVGGDELGLRRGISPWLQQEADNGNGDALMMLASIHALGNGVPQNQAKADALVERAASAGHPRAMVFRGASLAKQGRNVEAISLLRQGLDGAPGERTGALWLYVARMRMGQAELAQRELENLVVREKGDWPAPIAAYYLGKLTEEQLLTQARADGKRAAQQTCLARTHIAEQYAIAGDPARAEVLRAEVEGCSSQKAHQT